MQYKICNIETKLLIVCQLHNLDELQLLQTEEPYHILVLFVMLE